MRYRGIPQFDMPRDRMYSNGNDPIPSKGNFSSDSLPSEILLGIFARREFPESGFKVQITMKNPEEKPLPPEIKPNHTQ
jgi:hypothetical protein